MEKNQYLLDFYKVYDIDSDTVRIKFPPLNVLLLHVPS